MTRQASRPTSAVGRPDDVALVPVDVDTLQRLAAGEIVAPVDLQVADGAWLPPHVAARSLAQLALGTPALWCVPFLVVSRSRGRILGGCTFKTAPVEGAVEIGYGIAPSERGRGLATAAVRELLDVAAASGLVREVVACIVPDNVASATVVSRLGFVAGDTVLDHDGEAVVRWAYRIDP